ncbi:MFS transporter [Mycobacterium spongiae]|uniref:MFS transporter n=1 Tax=Mycobacterium spongiae TaxID=886343 RepID=A0A975K1B3_9MYCO|nr:MFS transporter [Mycobacterium spongiae]QUR69243.1 MFS transporter [Mycobacterium spongiae]
MRRLVVVLTAATFLDGYILGIIGPVTQKMSDDLGLSSLWLGLIAAAPLLAIFVGAPLGGWAADKFGRKPVLMVDMGLFVILSGVQLFVDSPVQLVVARLLIGIAIGIQYAMGSPLMSEFAPAAVRGRLLGLTLVTWYAGFMAAFLVGYVLVRAGFSWQAILAASTVIAVPLFIVSIKLPESPRWLWSQGRHQQALSIARRYTLAEIADVEHEHTRTGTFRMLFSPDYRLTTLFTSGFWFCAVTPYFAIATFADSVLAGYGLGGGLAGWGFALSVAGVVVMVLLIDKIGRRPLVVSTQWLCAVFLAAIGLWAGAPPIIVLALYLAFSFATAICGGLTNIYTAEVFPTEVRAIGMGFAAAFSRIGAALGTFLLPWSMANLGTAITMGIAAGIAATGAALSQWLAPETRGKSLTEASAAMSR